MKMFNYFDFKQDNAIDFEEFVYTMGKLPSITQFWTEFLISDSCYVTGRGLNFLDLSRNFENSDFGLVCYVRMGILHFRLNLSVRTPTLLWGVS